MLRTGKMEEIANELERYDMDVTALQEIRWKGAGCITKKNYSLYYSGTPDRQGLYGTGFCVNAKTRKAVLGFEPINERLSKLRLKGKFYNITFVSAYAPTEEANEENKDEFYDNLIKVCEGVSRHDALVILGDFNGKVGKEPEYLGVTGKYSMHETTNDNGERMCYLAAASNLVISSTHFQHKRIHKGTWRIPGSSECNQIDHVLISKRRANTIEDVRVCRGANCDSDHYLVKVKMRQKIESAQTKEQKKPTWNCGRLNDKEILSNYHKNIADRLQKQQQTDDIEKSWESIKACITEAAREILGETKRERNDEWYDDECREAMREKNEARRKCMQRATRQNVNEYKEKRKIASKMCRRKKRESINRVIENMELQRDQKNPRKFYKTLSSLTKPYLPKLSVCRNREGKMLSERKEILERWREHFESLLNRTEDCQNEQEIIYYTAEENIKEPTLQEVTSALKGLKNNKASGADAITAELIKKGGAILEEQIHGLIVNIWNQEVLPEEWKSGIIIPVFKKGDKTICDNYRGITILNAAYKVFSSILYKRLQKYGEEIIGDYQSGFRPNRSTIDHIHFMRQTAEKAYEYNIDLHHLFVDFKQAFDSVSRPKMLDQIKALGIPLKYIRLIRATLEGTKAMVRVNNGTTESFEIQTGVRQGDALSTLLFNLVIEAICRKLGIKGLINYNAAQICAYADDIVITSKSRQGMVERGRSLKMESAQYGLHVNEKKTKYMNTSREPKPLENVMVDGQQYEGVENFTYLGSVINRQGKIEEELKSRLLSANRCYHACKDLLGSKLIGKKSKLQIYKTVIRPVVTYGCETWAATQNDEKKLEVFERQVLRRIAGPTKLEDGHYVKKMNHELEALIGQETLTRFCKSQRLRWAGHLERMDKDRAPKIMTRWVPQMRRPRGRPRKRWMDCIEEDWKGMNEKSEWRVVARDRSRWRRLVEEAKTRSGS